MQTTILDQILSNQLFFWLSIAFAAVTLIQLIYFWGFFARLIFTKTKPGNTDLCPVSVVIISSNQYNDLNNNLQFFLTQDYPDFEVVVVTDNSDDGSDELLMDFSRQFRNLKIVELKQRLNWFSGRKFPLSLGIKSAKNDTILLSDLTCKPESKNWIREMASAYLANKTIVIGYSTYATKSHINKWLRFTAFYDALFYVSMAMSGIPFKGLGKNLSYSRNLFYKHHGFCSHYVISYGDDEIFVNRAAKKSNTIVRLSPQSRVVQVKKVSLSKWLSIEKTRIRIRRFFKFRHRLLIRVFSISVFLFYGLMAALLILKAPIFVTLSIFALRFISQLLVFGFAQKKLAEKNILLLSTVFEIFLILLDFFIWITLLFNRKKKWA